MTAAQPVGRECPSCKLIDQVQKVSAVVKTGTTTGALIGTTTGDAGDASHTLSHESQTVLSKLLASPQKPKSWWALWLQVASRAFIVVLLALVVGLAAATSLLVFGSGQTNLQYATVVQILSVGACLFVFGLIAYINTGNRTYNRLRKKWKRTYYCHRCDLFFIPGVKFDKKPHKPLIVTPEDMQKWLRARKWKK